MSTPAIIMWCVVLGVGLPSAWRNPTAGALVLCWIVVEGIYLLTGNNLAVEYYIYPDIAVLAVIACKPPYRRWQPRGTWERLQGIILDRSPADRVVMLIFPAMWTIYLAPIHPFYAWWGLWALAIVQFLAAALESLSKFRRAKAAMHSPDNHTSGAEYRIAWGRAGSG